jgi:hypothetical protein
MRALHMCMLRHLRTPSWISFHCTARSCCPIGDACKAYSKERLLVQDILLSRGGLFLDLRIMKKDNFGSRHDLYSRDASQIIC